MKQTFQLSVRVIGIVLILSCNKFLDEKADKSLNTPSTINDAQALLDDGQRMNETVTPGYGENAADDYFLPATTYAGLTKSNQQFYLWDSTFVQPQGTNDWSKSYLPIYNSNLALEILNKQIPNATNIMVWKNAMGSALFFRSFFMFKLLQDYAKAYDISTAGKDPGIVLRLSSDFNIPSVRSSVEDCYRQIIIDAQSSSAYLPELPQHVYRPSKAAAFGLLAQIYLSMHSYDSSARYADSCLTIKKELMDLNGDGDINGSLSANMPFKTFNKEILFYTEMYKIISLATPLRGRIDTTLYNSYSSSDLRKTAYFKVTNGYPQFKGFYASSSNTFFTGIAVDEIMLIAAESNLRIGKTEKAIDFLNTFLSHRINKNAFVPIKDVSGLHLMDTVLNERRKELLMRGVRWAEIKRLNKEGYKIIPTRIVDGKKYILPPNSPYYALPIPKDLIDLTGMEQN